MNRPHFLYIKIVKQMNELLISEQDISINYIYYKKYKIAVLLFQIYTYLLYTIVLQLFNNKCIICIVFYLQCQIVMLCTIFCL